MRRPQPPQQPAELAPVFPEPRAPALGVKVVLIPESILLLRRCGNDRSMNIMEVVAALRNKAPPARRKERCEDTTGAPAPIVADMRRSFDLERVHEREKIMHEHRLLARARRFGFKKTGWPVAAQIRHDGSVAGLDEARHHPV